MHNLIKLNYFFYIKIKRYTFRVTSSWNKLLLHRIIKNTTKVESMAFLIPLACDCYNHQMKWNGVWIHPCRLVVVSMAWVKIMMLLLTFSSWPQQLMVIMWNSSRYVLSTVNTKWNMAYIVQKWYSTKYRLWQYDP